MATNQTEHYGLSQWEPEDSFLREEFNQDHRKIDAALTAKCEVVIGAYMGDGAESQLISLGFTPKAVLIVGPNGVFTETGNQYGGLGMAPIGEAPGTFGQRVHIVEGGFQVFNKDRYNQFNNAAWHYYIAFK